jgi:hypothetical protein
MALDWMESYVTGRLQAVLIDGYVSSHVLLRYGVSQGSVLGPIVFTLYTSLLHDLICTFGIIAISSLTTPNSTKSSGFRVV